MSNGAVQAETGMLKFLKAITWVVYVLATAAELFLTFMFFLQMFGANPDQPFVAFIYRWGSFFARPFVGIIPPTSLGGIAFINWNAVVAFAAYAVLAWLIGLAMGTIRRKLYVDQRALEAEAAPVAVASQQVAAPAAQPEPQAAPAPQPAPQAEPQPPAPAAQPAPPAPPVGGQEPPA